MSDKQPNLSIYDFPNVYDIVLRAPLEQIETEVSSIRGLLAARGIERGRILDLACGTCAHGIRLAQHGFAVTGIDISTPMLVAAKQHAACAGIEIDFVQADILDLDLDVEPFDCAIFMAETFPLITEYTDLVRHFRSLERHLKPGGLYVVDIDAHRRGVGTTYQIWGEKTVDLDNGQVEIWHEDFPGDWVRGTSHMAMHCTIRLGDEVHETVDDWEIRMDSPWHLSLLLKTLDGWSLVGFYSWRDLSEDIADEAHYFMVVERVG